MKIRLINFRCYEDRTFEFGDSEINLISAPSGVGKSTILMGIYFALYGSIRNVISKGKKSCRVELEYEDIKIVRDSGKDKVIVNELYEGTVAQKIINERFGEAFDVTGYISQDISDSFIKKKPVDKLEFLEQFAFKDVNLNEVRKRNKTITDQRKETLNKTIGQLESALDFFKDLEEPIKVDYPFKKSKHDYVVLVKNENVKLKKCDRSIKDTRNEIEKVQTELNDLRILKTNLNNKDGNIVSLTKRIEKLEIEESNIVYTGDESLKKYKDILDTMLSHKVLITLEEKLENDLNKLEEMKKVEIEKLEKDLETINTTLWKEYTEEELKGVINDTKSSLKDAKHISFLTKQLKDCYVDEVELEKNKKTLEECVRDLKNKNKLLEDIRIRKLIYECPSCNSQLRFKENKLYISVDSPNISDNDKDSIEKDISSYKKRIKYLEDVISTDENKIKRDHKLKIEIENITSNYEEDLNDETLEEDLEYLENYYKAELAKEKQKKNIQNSLTNNVLSSSYKITEIETIKLQAKIEKIKDKISDIELGQLNLHNEEELRNLIIQEEKFMESLERIKESKYKIDSEKDKILGEIEELKGKYLKKYTEIKDEILLEKLIEENKTIIEEKEKKKKDTLLTIEKIKKYEEYINAKTQYDSWEDKIKFLKAKETEDRLRYSAYLILKEKIKEAESIAIINIVDSINMHAQIYLDSFFVDNPIIVRLLPFKETEASTKPQINIKIDYKEMECDLSSLSGGEESRVILAFTLALAEMFNTPFLMLDESTASLDQDTTTLIFDSIKENFKDKMVIIIAHQVVEGVFDRILKL